jgi:hypothetical protein
MSQKRELLYGATVRHCSSDIPSLLYRCILLVAVIIENHVLQLATNALRSCACT